MFSFFLGTTQASSGTYSSTLGTSLGSEGSSSPSSYVTLLTTIATSYSSQPTTSGTSGSPGTPGTSQPTTSGTPATGETTPSGTTRTGQPTTPGKYCDEMEYINALIETNSVKTTPTDITDKEDLIKKGVDFTDKKPSFIIDVPNGGAIVRDIELPSSNVAEIEVTFTTASGSKTTPIQGAPTSFPTDKFPTEKVVEIVITVTKTTDNKPPKDVTLSVIACAEGTVTTTPTGI